MAAAEHDKWERRAPWLGVGLMYVWACALVAWAPYARGGGAQIVGIAGVLAVVVSCAGIALYVRHLHEELGSARRRITELQDGYDFLSSAIQNGTTIDAPYEERPK